MTTATETTAKLHGPFNAQDMATMRTALVAWAARCEEEGRVMAKMAEEYAALGEARTASLCRSNAEASARFAVAAQSTLAKF